MKVRIKSCINVRHYEWYHDFIGRVFNAEWEFKNKLLTGRLLIDGKVILRGDIDFVDEDSVDDVPLQGAFTYVNGKVDLKLNVSNISNAELKAGLVKLKEEIERQIAKERLNNK